jgi:hypothetical protein
LAQLLQSNSAPLKSFINWLSSTFTVPATFDRRFSAPFVTGSSAANLLGRTDPNQDIGSRAWESTIASSQMGRTYKVVTKTGYAPEGSTTSDIFGQVNITNLAGASLFAAGLPIRDVYRVGAVNKTTTTIRAIDLLASRVPLEYSCGPSRFAHPNVANSAVVETIRCNITSNLPTFNSSAKNVLPVTDILDQFTIPCGFKSENSSTQFVFGTIDSTEAREDLNYVEFFKDSGVVVRYQSCYQFGYRIAPQFFPISVPA